MSLKSGSDASKPVIPVLTGATGAGKSSLAYRLMDEFPNIELISADSRQIYKYLDIGTAKPTHDEMKKYPMHLVDCIEPGERFTAFDFVEKSRNLIDSLFKKNTLPLICGGTGLYIRSLVEGIVEIPEDDLGYRDKLIDEASSKGPKYLYEKLQKVDPVEAERIHPHNIKKIIRALEIFHLTGKPKSELMSENKSNEYPYSFQTVCFVPPRDELYDRINQRVDLMMDEGLLAEAEGLYKGALKSAIRRVNVIGYEELFRHFDGDLSLEEAVNLIKQNSRRYAKRQITWFHGSKDISIFDNPEDIYENIRKITALFKN